MLQIQAKFAQDLVLKTLEGLKKNRKLEQANEQEKDPNSRGLNLLKTSSKDLKLYLFNMFEHCALILK